MPLAVLKELALRLLASELATRAGERSRVEEDSADAAVEALRLAFSTIPKERRLLEDDNQSLERWLLAHLAQARRAVRHLVTNKNGELVETAVSHIRQRIHGLSCVVCSGKGRVSRRRRAQSYNSQGPCLALIHDSYSYLYRAVEHAVVDWAFDSDRKLLSDLEVTLTTDPEPTDHRAIPVSQPYQVQGYIGFRGDSLLPRRRVSSIGLQVVVSLVDWRSALAIPWLLMHELACHAFQGWIPNGDDNTAHRNVEPDCPFYEGWMDEVAHQLLMSDLQSGYRVVPGALPAFMDEHRTDIVGEAIRYRDWRYGQGLKAEKNWMWGRRAAQQALKFFETRQLADDEPTRLRGALRQLVRLSYQIQRNDPGPLAADVISTVRGLCVCSRREGIRSAWLEDVEELLGARIDDLSAWLKRGSALERSGRAA